MSDEALRGSERRWRGAGGAEALARLMLTRVRTGTLPEEAGAVAERLAAGTSTVEDLLVAGLVGHVWARELMAEQLAEACAYGGTDAALADGPAGLLELLHALHAIGGRRALGEALVAVVRRARDGIPAPAPQPGAHGHVDPRHADEVRRIDLALEALVGSLRGDERATADARRHTDWVHVRRGGGVGQVRWLVGHTANVLTVASAVELPSALRSWIAFAAPPLSPAALRETIRDVVAPARLGLAP